MSEGKRQVLRGADGRWLKGQSSPAGPHVSRGLYGTRDLQRKLEGQGGAVALQKVFRRRSVAVMHALRHIILDPTTPASVRVTAAQLFLERGWGKIEADGAAPKRAKTKDGPIVIVRRTPRSPYKNSGGV